MRKQSTLPPLPDNLTLSGMEVYVESVKNSGINADDFIQEFSAQSKEPSIEKILPMMSAAFLFSKNAQKQLTDIYADITGTWVVRGKVDDALAAENFLYAGYLKKRETEDHYNDFYSKLSKVYNAILPKTNLATDTDFGLLFVLHTANFLAHVNPLISMLRQNGFDKNRASKVGVVVLDQVNSEFLKKMNELGVEVYSCGKLHSISARIVLVERIRSELRYKHVIWQCLPMWLPFAERFISNLSWWSVKFHPGISGLRRYIGSIGSGKDFTLNGNTWCEFSAPISIKNLDLKRAADWSIRKGYIGCFTREELIDNKLYWEIVIALLTKFKHLEFHYTGRSTVHDKWLSRDQMIYQRIKFLGWLSNPEKQLTKYAFLLDPFPLGHGNMAREALAAYVPIVYPRLTNDRPPSVIHKLVRNENCPNSEIYSTETSGKHSTSYNSQDQLLSISEQLLTDQNFNNQAAKKYRELLKTPDQAGNFSNFQSILD